MNSVPKNLIEMKQKIAKLPDVWKEELDSLIDKCVEESQRRTRIYDIIQESLEQIRLDVKYLQFDLEATRRERDQAVENSN